MSLGMRVGAYYRGFREIHLVASSKDVFSNCWSGHIPVFVITHLLVWTSLATQDFTATHFFVVVEAHYHTLLNWNWDNLWAIGVVEVELVCLLISTSTMSISHKHSAFQFTLLCHWDRAKTVETVNIVHFTPGLTNSVTSSLSKVAQSPHMGVRIQSNLLWILSRPTVAWTVTLLLGFCTTVCVVSNIQSSNKSHCAICEMWSLHVHVRTCSTQHNSTLYKEETHGGLRVCGHTPLQSMTPMVTLHTQELLLWRGFQGWTGILTYISSSSHITWCDVITRLRRNSPSGDERQYLALSIHEATTGRNDLSIVKV